MSDSVKHECGIALIRLLKPLQFYQEKYGTALYGLNKLNFLMEKQFNRGQDGAGVASIKLDPNPGARYISRYRSNEVSPVKDIFSRINNRFNDVLKNDPSKLTNADWVKNNLPFTGELLLGHLRYGTYGGNSIENCHPFLRQNNWKSRNLVVAGNFNLTNVDELFQQLVELGQHPKQKADTVTVMERIGHFLDREVDRLFKVFKNQGYDNAQISPLIEEHLDVQKILTDASKKWDGGYAMVGLIGHGDAFVIRDPWGIRPAYYFYNDEIAVVASERSVIQTAFNVPFNAVKEVNPGHAFIIKKSGQISMVPVRSEKEIKRCSFEHIYFSRGNDGEIYHERKMLGDQLVEPVLKSVNYDIKNTVFSYIPNTAEVAYYGLVKGIERYHNQLKAKRLINTPNLTPQLIHTILEEQPRFEKIAIKDAKMRTFITADNSRNEMVSSVYDITYNTVVPGVDNLVVIDDSIVRGTTLKQSILRILDRLGPKKIIIVSSAPQIRYPDCYGIDMAKIGEFIAFEAAIQLLKETGRKNLIEETYQQALIQSKLPKEEIINVVKNIYKPFTADEISKKISTLLRPNDINAEIEIIYQSIEGLNHACPNNLGDWYFTGNYPTPGGNKVVNRAFINYIEKKNVRAY
ncbi:MAG: class II glutamine amidotransferase [Bacteroidia bacterium]|nr:class II glutamine amidotransferase [Bacteroidia bacterium]